MPATAPVVEYRPTSAAHDHRRPAMTDKPYPDPPRPTIDDLDPEIATADRLIAMARGHREGQEYPTAEALIGNLPKVLRALCDHVLTGQATPLDVAYRLASLIDAIEGVSGPTRTDLPDALTSPWVGAW